jgi:predicted transcriptional regulator
VLEDVRANPGTSAKAIHERLSKVRPMHATSPNIWLGVLMEKGLVRREKGEGVSAEVWVLGEMTQ